jgi:deoxyadenosine/deoxycytidine kinase
MNSQINKDNVEFYSIEGNIGSGKTTLLNELELKKKLSNKKNKKVIFLREPVDEWEKIKDKNGITMLEKFYENQEKYSFSFQMMAYISRLQLLKEAVETNPGAIIISERSLFTDKLVFAKMLFDNNKIEDINYLIYLKWFETFSENYPLKKVIYIKTDPDICLSRIEKRSRQGENNISLEYLIECDKYHEEMMNSLSVEKMVLDGNIDIHNNENKETLNDWINCIEQFIL